MDNSSPSDIPPPPLQSQTSRGCASSSVSPFARSAAPSLLWRLLAFVFTSFNPALFFRHEFSTCQERLKLIIRHCVQTTTRFGYLLSGCDLANQILNQLVLL